MQPKLGEVYTVSSESGARTSVVVWVSGNAYQSYLYTDRMDRLVKRYGDQVLFLWIAQYHVAKWLRIVWSEFTYSQW